MADGTRKSEVTIARAERSDLQAILALQYLAFQSEAELLGDFSLPPLTQTYEEIVREYEKGLFLKALDANHDIVGSVRAHADQDTAFIGKLVVHPARQGRGIGAELLLAVEQECPRARYELFTRGSNERTVRLYERLGYVRFREQAMSSALTFVYLEKSRAPL